RMAASGVSAQAVLQALKAAQVDLPVGTTNQSDKTLPVQVVGTARTTADLKNLIVSGSSAGSTAGSPAAFPPAPTAPVTLGEVATVQDAAAPVGGITRTDGQPSLTISALLAPDGNAISLSRDVRSRLSRLHLDGNDSLRLVYDTANDIQGSLNDLIVEGLAGAGLA